MWMIFETATVTTAILNLIFLLIGKSICWTAAIALVIFGIVEIVQGKGVSALLSLEGKFV